MRSCREVVRDNLLPEYPKCMLAMNDQGDYMACMVLFDEPCLAEHRGVTIEETDEQWDDQGNIITVRVKTPCLSEEEAIVEEEAV